MARISTYAPDVNITAQDKLLGSSYQGKQGNNVIYTTANFKVSDLLHFVKQNVDVSVGDLNFSLSDINGDILANQQAINDLVNGLSDLRVEVIDQIETDLAALQAQTTESISLLDTTLNQAIGNVADTITTEVSNLNDRILQGETDLAEDIVALGDTITLETQNLTTLINTETGLISQTVNDLDNSIQLQLGDLNLDIAGALQEAIDAGSLATAAQASVDAEVIARTSAVGAVAGKVETIETQFTFNTEDGSIVGASGALAETITTTASTAAGAVATRVDILETEYVLSTEDGSIVGLSENSITNVALTTVTGAVATRVDTIETQFTITDGVVTGFSQAARDRIDTSISNATSAQFQTLDTIKTQFVFDDQTGNITAVSDVIQTSITDSISDATSAQFTKLDEVATQFVFDANNDITGVQGTVSSTIDSAKLEAISTADLAAQSKVDTFAAKIVTTDANGNITGLSDAVQTSVSDVVAQDGYAESSRVDTLETTVGDASSGLVQSVNTNATNTSANATKITNLNATLDILNADGTVKKNTADFFQDIRADVDANSATASKAETLRVNIEGQDGTGGLTASVSTAQEAIGNINGKLTASYGVHVNAGGKIAGLKLLADSTTTSSFIAQADEFGVDMPNGTRVLTVDSNGLLINGSGTFTGDFNAGLVEIRSNTIKLKATPSYGSTGDIEFYNQSGVLFGAIRSRSINVGGTDHDAITIGSPFAGALDTVVIDGQSIIANPADYSAFETGQGGVQFGNFVSPWETVGLSASQSISLRTGDPGVLVDPPNSIFMNNGGPGVIWTSISSEGYVSINSAGAIYLNPGESSGVFINGVEIGTGGTATDTTRSDEEIRDVIASFATAGSYISVSHNDAANTLTFALNTGTADTRYLRRDTSGTVNGTITATDFIVASDQRIKHDISTYDPGTVNINFRSYRLNSSPDRLRYGVIAQELERDHPEMVITNPDTGMKAVSYVDMLVAKVAELEKRIKQLENGGS